MATVTRVGRGGRAAPPPLPPLLLLLGATLVFLALLPGSAGLHCWVCRSDNEPRCEDPFNNTTLSATNCSQIRLDGEARFCSKMRAEVNGKTVYFRSCSDKEGLCPNVEHAGFCSTCKKDYCNAGERPRGSSLLVTAIAIPVTIVATKLLSGSAPFPV